MSAVLGILIGLGGLLGLWATKSRVTGTITGGMALSGKTLNATGDMIEVAARALNSAGENLALITALTADVAETLSASQELIGSTADLVGTDLTGFVSATQASLQDVEESASMVDSALSTIDNTLQLISRIPFLGSGLPQADPSYQPRVPLKDSVSEVSKSLDPLYQSFGDIESQLDTSAEHAATIQAEIDRLSSEVADIETTIEDARAVTDQYREIIHTAQTRFEVVEQRLPVYLNVIYLGLTLLLVWLLISQIAMLAHGIEILRG